MRHTPLWMFTGRVDKGIHAGAIKSDAFWIVACMHMKLQPKHVVHDYILFFVSLVLVVFATEIVKSNRQQLQLD